MRPLLILLFTIITCTCTAQMAFLFIKRGVKKVNSIPEGAYVRLGTTGGIKEGYITLLKNDSIYLNGHGFHVNEITRIYLHNNKMFRKNEIFYTAIGVVLSTLILRLVSSRQDMEASSASPAMIGVGNLLIQATGRKLKYKRAAYPIGRRFRVQVFSLRPF